MSHLAFLPFLIPFAAAGVLLLSGRSIAVVRAVAAAAVLAGLVSAVALVAAVSGGEILVYRLGNWEAPFGIVFVADRLAAMMVLLLFVLAVPALLAAMRGTDARGLHFHALFQLQLAGIAGAFLTGDLFNLFVCFEILLIASYALLLHAGGLEQTRAGLTYVALNLVGSSLFLVGLGLLYGTMGTLNLADLAFELARVPPSDVPLVRVALMGIVLVFLLKAAVLPMAFWLPHAYAAASVPVAALFAILTKVGVVALLRLVAVALPDSAVGAELIRPWLPALALLTVAFGTLSALAARRLMGVAASLVLVSSGTLLFAVADGGAAATAAILYYLPHTTLVTAGLFLLAGAVAAARGEVGDRLVRGPALAGALPLGIAFAVLSLAVSGMPPLSGFLGKLMLLQGAGGGWQAAWWTVLLVSGLVTALVLARIASLFFWEPKEAPAGPAAAISLPLVLLVLASPALTLAAPAVAGFAGAAASQLNARIPYMVAVMGAGPDVPREQRP
ncbi:monovalent cation/H+ antiporter subunit D [Thermaurantiacus sp.]